MQVAIDIALPRTRLGKISESTTQLKGASVKVNAPVGTNIAARVRDGWQSAGKIQKHQQMSQGHGDRAADQDRPPAEGPRQPEGKYRAKRDPAVDIDTVQDGVGSPVMPASMKSVGVYMRIMLTPLICENTISTMPMIRARRTPGRNSSPKPPALFPQFLADLLHFAFCPGRAIDIRQDQEGLGIPACGGQPTGAFRHEQRPTIRQRTGSPWVANIHRQWPPTKGGTSRTPTAISPSRSPTD